MKSLKSIFYFTLTLLLLSWAQPAFSYVAPQYRDLKPATQAMLEKQNFGTPVVASGTFIVSTAAGSITSAAATLSTFSAQPDVARNIVITPTGTTGDVESCVVVVNGLNYFGKSISENFTFAADASGTVTGSKAFKSVSSVVFPANCESGSFGATWNVGIGEKIGLKNCLAAAGDFAWSHAAGVFSATRPTVVASATGVENNTADFAETMNGSTAFVGYFVQNFLCLP